MTVAEEKAREHTAVELLKRYGKLLLKKHNHERKRKVLKQVKEMAKELAEKDII
jgi:hypothetical protein